MTNKAAINIHLEVFVLDVCFFFSRGKCLGLEWQGHRFQFKKLPNVSKVVVPFYTPAMREFQLPKLGMSVFLYLDILISMHVVASHCGFNLFFLND